MIRRYVVITLLPCALLACGRKETPSATVDAAQSASAIHVQDTGSAVPDARAIVESNCLSCHSEQLLEQQRLTPAQWANVVKKMKGWGAPLDTGTDEALVAYLSSKYGTNGAPFRLANLSASEAASAIEATADGVYASGDSTQGQQMFRERCVACHGENARGQLGVNLVERPLLYRANDFAQTVRNGRGKMPAAPLEDKQIADILAYLRTIHS